MPVISNVNDNENIDTPINNSKLDLDNKDIQDDNIDDYVQLDPTSLLFA
jgi:hypothetical protein